MLSYYYKEILIWVISDVNISRGKSLNDIGRKGCMSWSQKNKALWNIWDLIKKHSCSFPVNPTNLVFQWSNSTSAVAMAGHGDCISVIFCDAIIAWFTVNLANTLLWKRTWASAWHGYEVSNRDENNGKVRCSVILLY